MNLVPIESPRTLTGNYFCTWCSQSILLPQSLRDKADAKEHDLTYYMRSQVNEDFLFDSQHGLLSGYDFSGCRKDLIVVFDDGWDVSPDFNKEQFGSLILNAEHFPTIAVAGNPAQSLKNLSDKIKSLGYAGLGIWIAPQVAVPTEQTPQPDMETARAYWTERAKWCAFADIKYWKVDWGYCCGNAEYRKMMTDVCRQYAPELKIEHTTVRGPINEWSWDESTWGEGDARKDAEFFRQYTTETIAFSDYYRTYDVIEIFQNPITLDRIEYLAKCMEKAGKTNCILSTEHLTYIASALGCAIGMMFHPAYLKKGSRANVNQHKIDESYRAVRWSRIAQPYAFSGKKGEMKSDGRLTDSADLNLDSWPFYKGFYKQSSPATLARNCQLPEVTADKNGNVPYVCAVKYPTGEFAVAALTRTLDEKHENEPVLADVRVFDVSADRKVGVFGQYNSLTIDFDASVQGKKVLLQDLMGDCATDCTNRVAIDGNRVIIPGALIDEIGLSAKSAENDTSAPGLVLAIVEA